MWASTAAVGADDPARRNVVTGGSKDDVHKGGVRSCRSASASATVLPHLPATDREDNRLGVPA